MTGRPEEAEVRQIRGDAAASPWPTVEHQDAVIRLCDSWLAQGRVIEAARESVRREATSDYKSIYEAPTRIIGPVRDALARFDAACPADPKEQT